MPDSKSHQILIFDVNEVLVPVGGLLEKEKTSQGKNLGAD